MMPETEDDFGFVSFADISDDSDDFGFVSFNPPKKPKEEELLQLYGRQGKGVTELTSFPEEFDQQEQGFQPVQQEQQEQMGQFQQQHFEFEYEDEADLQPQQQQQQQFTFEGENDLEREIERNIAQQSSRMAEAAIGLPGDVWSFGKSLFGFDPETNLPTSDKLREFSEKASLGYTSPKNEFEQEIGEVQSDIASFMVPGSNVYSIARNIGIPIVANLAKEGIKYAGAEKLGNAAKIGTMVVLDLMAHRKGGARKYAGNLFNESEKLIEDGAVLKSSKFEKSLSTLEKSIESGGSAPSKERAFKKISEIKDKMKNGEIEIKELIDFRKSINEIKSELGGFEVQLPKHIKKKAIANLDKVKGEVIKALDEYGSKYNPEFGKLNKSANEAWAAIEQSENMGKFIKDTVKKSIKSPYTHAALGLGGIGAHKLGLMGGIAKGGAAGAAIAPAAFAGYEGYKILHQIVKSPTLRKYYGNILKGAASGNASQVIKNAKLLDEEFIEIEE